MASADFSPSTKECCVYSQQVRELGLAFGPTTMRQRTGFGDNGNVRSTPSPLRLAYRHIEPTLVGFLAGAMRLLRDPYVVYSLTTALPGRQVTLADHLLRILGAQLTAVYGDLATLIGLRNHLSTAHQRIFRHNNQPDWFREAVRGGRDFRPSDHPLAWNTTVTLASAIANVHEACGLIGPNDGYLDDLFLTVVEATGLEHGRNGLDITGLWVVAKWYEGVDLMGPELLQAAGVPAMLDQLVATPLGNGITIGTLLQKVVAFMYPQDREALGLDTPDAATKKAVDRWSRGYSNRNSLLLASKTDREAEVNSSDGLTANDLFTVSFRGRKP